MGRLTADPELRHTPSDVAVTSFTLAVDRAYVKTGTERQTDFIDVVAWRNAAEFVCRYFRKGQLMAVHGSIQTRSYTDKDGNKRKAFEIVADDINFAGAKKEDGGHAYGHENGNAPETTPAAAHTADITADGDTNYRASADYVQRRLADMDLSFEGYGE
jgi:single-strand DNA-binding protein